jgi:hypothetical protein
MQRDHLKVLFFSYLAFLVSDALHHLPGIADFDKD